MHVISRNNCVQACSNIFVQTTPTPSSNLIERLLEFKSSQATDLNRMNELETQVCALVHPVFCLLFVPRD